jgi:hypothetical protein
LVAVAVAFGFISNVARTRGSADAAKKHLTGIGNGLICTGHDDVHRSAGMVAGTKRIVVQVTPDQKRAIV